MNSSDHKGRRALVTGAAGFLGSHLCERLVHDGMHVVGIDDFTTGHTRNLGNLVGHPRFTFIEYDVTTPFYFNVDYIFNLACPASPPHYQKNPTRTTLTSVIGTLHCLELAHNLNARFLQASTSEVYGDPLIHPQSESYAGCVNPVGIRACYDEGKRCAESLIMDYHRQYDVDVRIVRIFNTYGPRMAPDDGRVVSNFIVQALRNQDLTIYGSGEQTRSFCYVDDLIEGFVRIMAQTESTGPVNLGNAEEFTILELAERVLRLTGSSSRLRPEPLPQDDPRQRRPDITLAKQLIDFSARTNLESGLKSTVRYFRELLNTNTSHAQSFSSELNREALAEPAQ